MRIIIQNRNYRIMSAFCCLLLTSGIVQAQERQIAKEICLLELNLPRGAQATIEGQKYGPRALVTFDSLTPEKIYSKQVLVRFADGQTNENKVLIGGGQHIQLTLQDPALQKPEPVPQTGGNFIKFATFTKDGQFLIEGDIGGVVFLKDAQTGLVLRTYQGHKNYLWGMQVTPDSRSIISGAEDTVIVWDLKSGRQIRKINPNRVFSLAIHPKGNILAVGENKKITLWDPESGEKLKELQGDLKVLISRVKFSPDGRYLACNGYGGQVVIWDIRTGQQLHRIETFGTLLDAIVFSPDSRQLVISRHLLDEPAHVAKGEIRLFDVVSGKQIRSIQDQISFYDIDYSPDGKLIGVVARSYDDRGKLIRNLLILDALTLDTVKTYSQNTGGLALFTPDGKSIYDGRNRWILSSEKEDSYFGYHSDKVRFALFYPNHSQIAFCSNSVDSNFELLDSRTLTKIRDFEPIQDHDYFLNAEISKDGQHLTGIYKNTQNGGFQLVDYNAQTGKILQHFTVSDEYLYDISFSANGSRVLLRSTVGKVYLWDVRKGILLRTLQFEDRGIYECALSQDGRRILTDSNKPLSKDPQTGDNFRPKAILWDADTGREIRTFQTRTKLGYNFSDVVFSPDDRLVYLSGKVSKNNISTTILAAFEVESGKLIKILRGHTDPIRSFHFSRNDRFIVAQHERYHTSIWDTREGILLRTFNTPTWGTDLPPSLSPDGSHLATCHPDGSLRITDVATGVELLKYIRLKYNKGWLAISPSDHFDGNAEGRKALAFRIGKGLNVVPLERFFQDFYYPGLIPATLRGNQPLATVEIGKSLPPVVKILSPETSSVSTQKLTIKAEATDQGGGISGLTLYQNSARVLTPRETRHEGMQLLRTFEVALVEGENHFEVKSATKDGSWESAPAEITLTYAQPLAKPSLHLVAIGINKYKTESINLKYASADATAMADLFEKRGPTLYGDKQVQVSCLLNEQATKAGIRKLMKQVAEQAQIQDTVVVFIAGHGVTLGQRYFFIPHEFQRNEGDMEEDIRNQGLAHDELGDMLAEVPSLKRVIIFDTCQSGGALPINRTARDPFAFRGALERLSRAQGHYVIGASAASQQAQETSQLKHGLLTYTLLAGMKAMKDGPLVGQNVNTSDKIVKVRDWFGYAQDKVPLLTKLYFGEEQFIEYTGRGESFPVLPLPE